MRIRRKIWIRRGAAYQVWSRVGALKGGSRYYPKQMASAANVVSPSIPRENWNTRSRPSKVPNVLKRITWRDIRPAFHFIVARTFIRSEHTRSCEVRPFLINLRVTHHYESCLLEKAEETKRLVVYAGMCKTRSRFSTKREMLLSRVCFKTSFGN